MLGRLEFEVSPSYLHFLLVGDSTHIQEPLHATQALQDIGAMFILKRLGSVSLILWADGLWVRLWVFQQGVVNALNTKQIIQLIHLSLKRDQTFLYVTIDPLLKIIDIFSLTICSISRDIVGIVLNKATMPTKCQKTNDFLAKRMKWCSKIVSHVEKRQKILKQSFVINFQR